MMRFLIPIAQPPKATRNKVRNGRNQCVTRLQMNGQFQAGMRAYEKPPEMGKKWPMPPAASKKASSRANQGDAVAVRGEPTGRGVIETPREEGRKCPMPPAASKKASSRANQGYAVAVRR